MADVITPKFAGGKNGYLNQNLYKALYKPRQMKEVSPCVSVIGLV